MRRRPFACKVVSGPEGDDREPLLRVTLAELWCAAVPTETIVASDPEEAARRLVADRYDEDDELEDGTFAMYLVVVTGENETDPHVYDVTVDVTVDEDADSRHVEVDVTTSDVTSDWTRVHKRCGQVAPRCTCTSPQQHTPETSR